jgi:hypothetical protein
MDLELEEQAKADSSGVLGFIFLARHGACRLDDSDRI